MIRRRINEVILSKVSAPGASRNQFDRKKNEMISWVRDRVATRWIQTRKRGDESATSTSQNTEEDEEEEDDDNDEERRNSFSTKELFLPKHNNEDEVDTDEQEHSPRLIKASSPHVTCPLRPSSSPRENRKPSSSPTNRSARLEKHNSKLEM